MPEARFLSVVSGGRRIGFPITSLRAIKPWEMPRPLPGGATWLRGVLPGEGEVFPVLSEFVWGGESSEPEVNLFLEHGGRSLIVSGSTPKAISGEPGPVASAASKGCFSGILALEDSEVFLVDVAELYRALGLAYNEIRLG